MSAGIGRRLVFLKIDGVPVNKPYDLLSINAKRTPEFMMDVEIHGLHLLELKDLPKDTGWGKVPTPVF